MATTFDMTRYRGRQASSKIALGLACAATSVGLFFLGTILLTLLWNGLSALHPSILTEMTPAPGSKGGLLNAIAGTVAMTAVGVAIGTPVGILAGTWIAEYSRGSVLAQTVQFVNDILLSAPSIIIGLFVYELMVVPMGHFSAWAGSIALAILVIPVVLRTTVDMLGLVPNALREAAAALGTPEMADGDDGLLSRRAAGHAHRRHARSRPGQRRDGTLAVYRAQQPVLEHQHGRADGEPAGGDLPVRA